jgi:hypothetical protein
MLTKPACAEMAAEPAFLSSEKGICSIEQCEASQAVA